MGGKEGGDEGEGEGGVIKILRLLCERFGDDVVGKGNLWSEG